ncbi:MAG: DMT family transporter [Deltaproteobacteria bacterium]|nr:DMT family transporter [Deltaproteobacteria bacterium]
MWPFKILLATAASLVAFAANSLLARAALAQGAAGPASFTALRLVSGALVLYLVARWPSRRHSRESSGAGSWLSAISLFIYAFAFSWAYLSLSAGTGALILFGAVQISMIGWGLKSGERPGLGQWLGLVLALAGLVYLLSPGIEAPDPLGALLMTLSGVTWGIYSLRGRGVQKPILATAGNFLRSVPLALAALGIGMVLGGSQDPISSQGLILAIVSGAVTSGLGYVVWYGALAGLSATVAGVVQLAVPVLAALGGVFFLNEPLTLRLVVAGLVILAGIALASRSRQ